MSTQTEKHLVNGQDVENLIQTIMPSLENHPKIHILLACIAIGFEMLDSNLDPAHLREGVEKTSEWMSHFVAQSYEPIPKEKIN